MVLFDATSQLEAALISIKKFRISIQRYKKKEKQNNTNTTQKKQTHTKKISWDINMIMCYMICPITIKRMSRMIRQFIWWATWIRASDWCRTKFQNIKLLHLHWHYHHKTITSFWGHEGHNHIVTRIWCFHTWYVLLT